MANIFKYLNKESIRAKPVIIRDEKGKRMNPIVIRAVITYCFLISLATLTLSFAEGLLLSEGNVVIGLLSGAFGLVLGYVIMFLFMMIMYLIIDKKDIKKSKKDNDDNDNNGGLNGGLNGVNENVEPIVKTVFDDLDKQTKPTIN